MIRPFDPSRRRLLGWVAAAVGAGALGATVANPPDPRPTDRAPEFNATAAPVPVSTPPDTRLEAPTPTHSPPAAPAAGEVVAVCRAAWGALPPAGPYEMHTVHHMTVHHTGVPLTDDRLGPARARRHQRYHIGLGWPDLAYHFLVDRLGVVYEGRPRWARGDTATAYDPTGHLLVCLEGDFDMQEVTAGQLDALVDLLAWGGSRYRIPTSEIRGHHDLVAETSCPGTAVQRLIDSGGLATMVHRRLSAPPVLRIACGTEAAAVIAAVEA